MSNFKVDLHKIKAFAFDVDGVMTDGLVLGTDAGDLLRQYNSKDGYAVRYAVSQGFPVAIITGGSSESIRNRYHLLDIKDVYLASRIKLPDFDHFCEKYNLRRDEVLFMGDDIPDIPVMQVCGMPVCPSDAVPEVKKVAKYISNFEGGRGCVRDIIEQVMKVHNKWMKDIDIAST